MLEDTFDIGIGSYLDTLDHFNMSLVSKSFQEESTSRWSNIYLWEKYSVRSNFLLSNQEIYTFSKEDDSYQTTFEMYGKRLTGKALPFCEKTLRWDLPVPWWKTACAFLDFYDYKPCPFPEQIFLDSNNKLSKWKGYYFEISFPPLFSPDVRVGFMSAKTSLTDLYFLLGWDGQSLAYHADDATVYGSDGDRSVFRTLCIGQVWILGCGYDAVRNEFFFTENGEMKFRIPNTYKNVENFIPVCCGIMGDLFMWNDGKKKFSTYSFL